MRLCGEKYEKSTPQYSRFAPYLPEICQAGGARDGITSSRIRFAIPMVTKDFFEWSLSKSGSFGARGKKTIPYLPKLQYIAKHLNMTNRSRCSSSISEFSHNIKELFIPAIFNTARLVDNVTDGAKPCQKRENYIKKIRVNSCN